MINIKILVLVLYFSELFACSTKYCKICPEHTLCKYQVSGPSLHCLGYDTNALLTEDDVNAILDKINERRNFIAIGRSKFLPAAANMKKIEWSEELATFAQRWVDQCDQALRSDRKDKCRDLDHSEVGQSIATITGSSSRYGKLSVKSFVEIWFMESMDYTGSVAYYNQSRDQKTNYFTQLIWADTHKVGCGKARFFVKNVKPIVVDRLVCNFLPKGNIHSKPVYTIGYPATQCDIGMKPDTFFPGLCSHQLNPKNRGALTSANPPTTSLLRILNLFNNNSVRQEIDPIYNNLKQMRKDFNRMSTHQNPMQAPNCVNNSYDAVKRSYPFKNEMFWNSQQPNNSTFYNGEYLQKREKGHSRVYHGHNHRNEFDYLHPDPIYQNARRNEYTPSTSVNLYLEQDYRKHNVEQQCTRKTVKKLINHESTECVPCKTRLNKCTRGTKDNCYQNKDCVMTTRKCEDQEFRILPSSRETCACNSFSTVQQIMPNRCAQNTNCDCVNINCPTKPCPHMLRTLRDISDEKFKKESDIQYYDLFSHITQQSTSRPILKESYKSIVIPQDDDNNPWLSMSKSLKSLDRRKQLKRNYSERIRRVVEEEENFKPFWQMDEYVNKNQPQLKSIRYTTISNKKSLKNRRTQKRPKTIVKTEFITVTYTEPSTNSKRITEKYLSFDELLHLRKHNAEDSRRYYDDKQILRESNTSTTTETPSTNATQEYSFNTPYVRMKYCTRKLTCTWTAASLTDSAGSIIPGGGGNAVGGSRTPPGYVEGCTRTSTCTRDYMNRNKMATLPTETTSAEPDPGDDEDYCERRSLNRRSNRKIIQNNIGKTIFENNSSNKNQSLFNESFNNCICYDINVRTKRQDYNSHNASILRYDNLERKTKNHIAYETSLLSYGDLYYSVVSKIIDMWKIAKSSYSHDKCRCNGGNKIRCSNFLLFLLVLKYLKTFL